MHEHIARTLYYLEVHLLYASIVWIAAWALAAIRGDSATTNVLDLAGNMGKFHFAGGRSPRQILGASALLGHTTKTFEVRRTARTKPGNRGQKARRRRLNR